MISRPVLRTGRPLKAADEFLEPYVIRIFFALALALALPAAAMAHSPVKATTPPDGVSLAAAPNEIAMKFDAPVRLTKVTVVVGDGDETALDLSGAKRFATEFKLPCTLGASGLYTVTWRALAKDGHAMKGDFRFKAN